MNYKDAKIGLTLGVRRRPSYNNGMETTEIVLVKRFQVWIEALASGYFCKTSILLINLLYLSCLQSIWSSIRRQILAYPVTCVRCNLSTTNEVDRHFYCEKYMSDTRARWFEAEGWGFESKMIILPLVTRSRCTWIEYNYNFIKVSIL